MSDGAVDVRREVLQMLLEKIEEDRFPSSTMMDMAEKLLGPDELSAYTAILLDKVRETRFPSMDMLRRVSAYA
ncbi:hypothetical protein HNR19_001647 [Nocardioides thalensis]|uniref:Uncharacterized protein n=1 Tax=Nocardioides thalensis TaxID=1914755 RepID=A0A853C0P6_9ACTN|nr:hypothetical protein [Nocardioides thalensis]NYJ00949.1 hypothetical protein [Nocardioides thalensis]